MGEYSPPKLCNLIHYTHALQAYELPYYNFCGHVWPALTWRLAACISPLPLPSVLRIGYTQGLSLRVALMMIFASPFMITLSRLRSLPSKISSSAALASASSGPIGKRELFTHCPHQTTFFISDYYPYSTTTCIFKNCYIYIDLVLDKFRRAPLRPNLRRLLGSDCDWGDALSEFLSIPDYFTNYCFRRLVLPLVFV